MGIAMQPEEFPRRRRNDPKEQANAFDASQGLRSDDFRTVAPGKGAGGAGGRNLPGPADHGAPACGSNHRCTGQGRVAAALPRFNRRFGVPAQCPEPAFRPLGPELRLGHILCFKHRRRVARDNTVKFTGTPCNCCPLSNAAATPERWSWCWRDWTAGCRYSLRDASSTPGKRRPVRHLSAAATRLPQLPPSRPPIPNSRQNLRLQLSNCRAQSRIRKKALTLRQLTIRT